MSDILIAQEVGTVVVIETAPAEIVEVVAVGPQGPVGDVNPQMPVILAATEAARDAALVSELAAATSQSVAATSAANAATSESNAATSAATATAQATASAGSATASAGSATASAGSAAAAQSSATNAATSETNAANSATASANSATSSANSATAAQAAQTATESARDTTLATIGTAALKANNLSDLANAATARSNLGLGNVNNTSDANKPVSTAQQTALNAKEATANKGVANGYAGLDSSGKVPTAQLPSYVDDVLEYANLAGFPGTGETGKIYIALDTNKIYRWTGSAYIEISPTAGTADAATKLATARTIAGVSFDGTANISIPFSGLSSIPTTLTGYGITNAQTALGFTPVQQGTGTNQGTNTVKVGWGTGAYAGKLALTVDVTDFGYSWPISITGNAATVTNGIYTTNIGTYAPTLTGTGASGTWGISISGNAASVTNGVYTTGVQTINGAKTFGDNAVFNGLVTVGNGQVASSILMVDADEGSRYIHCNSNYIGFLNQGGGWGAYCDDNNNWTAAGNITAYSDERLKTNWRTLGEGFINQLAGVKVGIYDRVDHEGVTQVGVSAQSLREVLPDAVIEDAQGTLSVSYGNAALAACVELAKEVVALRAEIDALKARG